MEKEYSKSIYVNAINGGILCYGEGSMDRPVALVQVNVAELRKQAAAAGKTFSNDEDLCNDADMEKIVLADLIKEAGSGVGRNEKLVAIKLISGNGDPNTTELNSPWTPENLFLTASNKLNRKPIQQGLDAILAPLILKGIQ